jgi:hypothetical protein
VLSLDYYDHSSDVINRLQTYASYPYNEYPVLSLSHGALYGNATEHAPAAVAGNVTAGDAVSFITPPQGPNAAQVWCGVVRPASVLV